jgi:hypothetical protein
MQGQLFTCGLHECDFIVCRVRELAQAECENMMDTTFDVARFGSVASFDDGSFKFSRPGNTFTELIEFDRHKADGATITFHHVFDFTVTASMAMCLGKNNAPTEAYMGFTEGSYR